MVNQHHHQPGHPSGARQKNGQDEVPPPIASLARPGWVYSLPLALFGLCLSALAIKPAAAQEQPRPFPEPVINVGIVQRFGANPVDELTLQALSGDRLTVQFETNGQEETITTSNIVKLDVAMQSLPEPKVTERVVLSTHRSFESAEDSANQWQARGIEVELAQPRQWQVWAKRDVYRTPLLRRLLLQNLRANGARTAFVDTQVQQQVPQTAIVINGYRYHRDNVRISTANSRVQVQTGPSSSNRRLYAGSLRLQPNAYGTYTLVNQVPIESYLRGVVPHEIGLSAPQTTIEAQAILARTYALRNLRRFAIDNYELCADTQCQVYQGLTGAAPASDQAIAATRGMVLTYQNELIDALYSSTTGGITAPFGDVWNGPNRPYLRAVVDSVQGSWDLSRDSLADEANFKAFISREQGFNEDDWDMFRWRVESTLPAIAADVKAYLQATQHPLANFSTVKQLNVLERSPAGRVQKVEVETDQGKVILEKDEILRALYAPNSTLFYLEPIYENDPQAAATIQRSSAAAAPQTPPGTVNPVEPSPTVAAPRILRGYAFIGGGLGHGVGMSQTGAYRLGRLGWSNSRILSFYYPGSQLQPLNESITFWQEINDSAAAPITVAPAVNPPETTGQAPSEPTSGALPLGSPSAAPSANPPSSAAAEFISPTGGRDATAAPAGVGN